LNVIVPADNNKSACVGKSDGPKSSLATERENDERRIGGIPFTRLRSPNACSYISSEEVLEAAEINSRTLAPGVGLADCQAGVRRDALGGRVSGSSSLAYYVVTSVRKSSGSRPGDVGARRRLLSSASGRRGRVTRAFAAPADDRSAPLSSP
jgi:hypothetical protein